MKNSYRNKWFVWYHKKETGMLYYADIYELEGQLHSEIEKVI